MDKDVLSRAIAALSNGDVIVYPTDTLYGLGADIYNDVAVRKVFEIKRRSLDNPLSIAVSCFEQFDKIACVDDKTRFISESFLPIYHNQQLVA